MSLNLLGSVKSVYTGILGGIAKQLPLSFSGAVGSSIPSAVPEQNYLGGPESNPKFAVVITSPAGDDGRGAVSVTAFIDGGQQVSMSAASQYSSPFDQGLAEMVGGELAGTVSRLFGIRTVTQSMTSQIWQGSEHICLTLNLLFMAESNAIVEVIDPIKRLMSLTLPVSGGGGTGFLTAPGPRVRFANPEEGGPTVDGGLTRLSALGSAAAAGAQSVVGAFIPGLASDPNGTPAVDIPSFGKSLEDLTGYVGAAIKVDNPTSISIGSWMKFNSVVIKSVDPSFEEIYDPNGIPMVARVAIVFETHMLPTVQDLDDMFVGSTPISGGAGNGSTAFESITSSFTNAASNISGRANDAINSGAGLLGVNPPNFGGG